MKRVNKSDIIDLVSERTGEKKDLSAKMVNETLTAIRSLMCSGDPEVRISIHDFGTFEIKKTRVRKNAGNHLTNESVEVPSRRRPTFTPGKYLNDAFKEAYEE